MKKLTIIVPCYNEEENIAPFYEAVCNIEDRMPGVELEFIFIDDGSKDKTVDRVKELKEKDQRVHYVSFSRNFGKEAGIYAGLERVTGDYAVIMDVDLQDPPELLPQMFEDLESGEYDCVATRRADRKGEKRIRSWFSRLFYKLMKKMTSVDIVEGARDFQMMNRQMVNAIVSMGEYNRFSKGIFGWVGFKKKWIAFENVERARGDSKWSFFKLFSYAIEGIVSFSTVPLSIAAFFGVLMCFIAFVMLIFIFVRALVFGDPTSGWPSLVCIILFIAGIQMFCLGIIGQYLAKTYMETKNRPKYLVRDEK